MMQAKSSDVVNHPRTEEWSMHMLAFAMAVSDVQKTMLISFYTPQPELLVHPNDPMFLLASKATALLPLTFRCMPLLPPIPIPPKMQETKQAESCLMHLFDVRIGCNLWPPCTRRLLLSQNWQRSSPGLPNHSRTRMMPWLSSSVLTDSEVSNQISAC